MTSYIFLKWRTACIALHPRPLISLLRKTVFTFAHAFMLFVRNFGLLLCADALFVIAFGDIMSKASLHVSSGKSIDSSFFLLTFLQSIMWLIISSAFLLMIRKNDTLQPKAYFRAYFFRYIKLTLMLSLIALMSLYVLIACGITRMPHMPWTLMLGIRIIEYCVVFFWLDSKTHVFDLFYSLDKAVNMAFYNAPFFAVLFVVYWGSDYGLRMLAQSITNSNIGHLLFINSSASILGSSPSIWGIAKALSIRYGTFIYEYFLVSVLFCFYRRNKHEQYTRALFEKS